MFVIGPPQRSHTTLPVSRWTTRRFSQNRGRSVSSARVESRMRERRACTRSHSASSTMRRCGTSRTIQAEGSFMRETRHPPAGSVMKRIRFQISRPPGPGTFSALRSRAIVRADWPAAYARKIRRTISASSGLIGRSPASREPGAGSAGRVYLPASGSPVAVLALRAPVANASAAALTSDWLCARATVAGAPASPASAVAASVNVPTPCV